MEELLPYYERELGFLRRYSREFSERYPKIAGRLQVGGEVCEDPHIERMIESFALLNAILSPRLGQLLDQQRYAAMFWTIALCPVVGVVVWWLLSRRQEVGAIK